MQLPFSTGGLRSAGIGLFCVLLGMLVLNSGEDGPSASNARIESFPEGDSGLADGSAEADTAKALVMEYTGRAPEAPAKPPAPDAAPSPAVVANPQEPAAGAAAGARAALKPEAESAPPAAPKKPGPGSVERARLSQPAAAAGPFRQFPTDGSHDVFQVLTDESGDIWIAARNSITHVKEGKEPKVILDSKVYDEEFNEELPPITGVALEPNTVLWVGFGNGMLMRYERYEWKVLSRAGSPLTSRVSGIVPLKSSVLFAGSGLAKWDKTFNQLVVDPNLKGTRFSEFLRTGEELYLGGIGGLWRHDKNSEDTWTSVLKLAPQDFTIDALAARPDGQLLLGTFNGMIRINERGKILERMLAGERITFLKPDGSRGIWIGTFGKGLKYFNGVDVFRVGSEHGLGDTILGAAIDSSRRLWVAVKDAGVYSAPLDAAAKWIQGYEDLPPIEEPPKVYSNLCKAAETLLHGTTADGDIATAAFEEQQLVFVRGLQRCPAGIGHHRVDGVLSLIRNEELVRVDPTGKSEAIPLPKDVPAEVITVVFRDSAERIWLGTGALGVLLLEGDKWTTFGAQDSLADNPVTSIIEDQNAAVWVGTTPHYDDDAKKYHLSNLHRYDASGWAHFDARDGLVQMGTHSLALMRDGTLVVGTYGGVSLLKKDGMVRNYTEPQGLAPYYSFSVSVDRKNQIWVAHQYYGDGVSWFDDKEIHRLTTKTKLFNDRIVDIAHDSSKRVWLRASNGTVGVYPARFLKKNRTSAPLNTKTVRETNLFLK